MQYQAVTRDKSYLEATSKVIENQTKITRIMKFLIVFALIVASALAAPPRPVQRQSRQSNDDSKNAQILKYENDNIGIDGYNFA